MSISDVKTPHISLSHNIIRCDYTSQQEWTLILNKRERVVSLVCPWELLVLSTAHLISGGDGIHGAGPLTSSPVFQVLSACISIMAVTTQPLRTSLG